MPTRLIRILLIASLLISIVIFTTSRNWELNLIARLQASGTPVSVAILQFITDFVDAISVGIPIALIIAGFAKSSRQIREKALLILLAVGLAGLLSNGLKRIVREPRPYEVDTRIKQWSGGGGFGFPSGHSADAMAAATAFTLAWPELYVAAVFYGWALLIMFSRIFLGVHDPGDVIAGMFLGILSALIIFRIRDTIRQRRANTIKQ